MASDAATGRGRSIGVASWKVDILAALSAALVVLLVSVVSGFPSLSNAEGDNDSLLRLVQLRDFIAGQGWFDLHQYRMGMPGGFEMHWSRLVDAPIAAIILVGATLAGSMTTGEMAALILWPLLLFVAALFLVLRCARAVGGAEAVLPGLVLGAAALHFSGLFAPGAIDHHNLQLVLSLGMITALLGADETSHGGALAGTCAALMVAVGMETMPYVLAAGLFVAVGLVFGTEAERRAALGFGLAFAFATIAAFFATVAPRAWGAARCDALSIVHLAIAAMAGVGLAGVAAFITGGRARRVAALLALAAAVAVVVLAFFPQCLDGPYDGLDPRLEAYWMSVISEAQPLWVIISDHPATAARYYATPMLGLAVLGLGLARSGPRRRALLVGLFLLTAVLVSAWQVRGAMFSIPFAAVALAAWVGARRRRAADTGTTADQLRMTAAWLLSLNVAWTLAAMLVSRVPPLLVGKASSEQADPTRKCQAGQDYDALAALPAGGVLSVANLGAPILRYTPHRVLAGLYHRNVEANLSTLSAFTGTKDEAEAMVRQQGLAYVVVCPGDEETAALAEKAPTGFIAALLTGELPPWLEPVAPDAPLRIYRVLPGFR